MKITRTATLIFLLSFPSIRRIFLLFSSPFSVSELVSSASKSSNFVLFIVLNAIVLAILLLGSLKPSSEDFDSFSHLSSLVCEVDYEAEKPKFKEEDIEIDEFVPRLVYVEYYKGEKSSEHERERILLLEYFDDSDGISDGFHGYDGYEEDNDDGSSINDADSGDLSGEEEDDENLEKRIEEFIAKTNKQWKEELLNDKWLLTAS